MTDRAANRDPLLKCRTLSWRWLSETVHLSWVRQFTEEAKDHPCAGDLWFCTMCEKFPKRYEHRSLAVDTFLEGPNGKKTIQAAIEGIFESLGSDSNALMQLLHSVLDTDQASESDPPPIWHARDIAMHIVQRDPASFFKLTQARQRANDNERFNYWDFKIKKDPRL